MTVSFGSTPKRHVYFEDPSCHHARGYLTWRELGERWHDFVGPRATPNNQVQRLGIVMWKPPKKRGRKQSAFELEARHID